MIAPVHSRFSAVSSWGLNRDFSTFCLLGIGGSLDRLLDFFGH